MMRLVQMHPATGFDSMVRRMNHLLNDLDVGGRRMERAVTAWAPRTDISEDASSYTLSMDIPGVPKEQVSVSVDDKRVLHVRGERADESNVEGAREGITVHRRERRFGSFERSFTLPDHVDADGIGARFEHGVLVVTLPKKEEPKPGTKTITVA